MLFLILISFQAVSFLAATSTVKAGDLLTFPSCASQNRPSLELVGEGRNRFRSYGIREGTLIDARKRSWALNNSANRLPTASRDCSEGELAVNPYPIIIDDVHNGCLLGASVYGSVPLLSERSVTYCNSAAIVVRAKNFELERIFIENVWDGIRYVPPLGQQLRVGNAYVLNSRDDCIENRRWGNMLLHDSLLDGCWMGISLDPGRCGPNCPAQNPNPQYIRLERVLLRLQPFHIAPFGSRLIESGAFFKITAAVPPVLEVHQSVFAFEDMQNRVKWRIKLGWERISSCSENLLLYLGDGGLPTGFPLPPACFKIVVGEEAREIWRASVEGWQRAHPDVVRFGGSSR